MAARPRLHAAGTDSTEFFQDVVSGRDPSASAWYEYLDRFHTAIPNASETLFTNVQTPGRHSSYEVLARAAASVGGASVLDAGCGNGFLMNDLLELFPKGTLFSGIDLCEAEIELGRQRFAAEPRVRLMKARAEALPFGDASFDLVVSHQMLNFVIDVRRVFAEVYRTLQPGGTFVFVVSSLVPPAETKNSYQLLYEVAYETMKDRYPEMRLPVVHDPRIYAEPGIREIVEEAAKFDGDRMTIQTFAAGAMMTPEAAAAMFGRHYIFASVPDNDTMFEKVEARAKAIAEAARSEVLPVELFFRLVQVQKPAVTQV
jgi:ubiquinone/menaquinone biosynthesis C-methylase UbiE